MANEKISTGPEIIIRENEDDSILKLAAQKKIYSKGKNWSAFRFWLAVLIMVVLSVLSLFLDLYYKVNIEWIVVGYSFSIVLLDNLFFTPLIKKLKSVAASIQEDFDTYVYNLSRKDTLVKNVEPEIIFENSKDIKELDKLKNWYEPKIVEIKNSAAVLICQRTNQSYDSRLRLKFIKLTILLSIGLFSLLMIMSLVKDLSARSVLMNAIIPFIPILQLAYLNWKANKESIENSEEIKNLIKQLWDASKIEGRHPSDRQLRDIQDRIFLHRSHSPLLPNWFYNFNRDTQESATHFSVDKLVNDYLQKDSQNNAPPSTG